MFIVRIFSEIAIKSPSVRKRWSKQLADNIRNILRRIDPEATVKLDWDRIIVRIKTQNNVFSEVKRVLANTPGIANFSWVQPHPFASMQDIYEHTQEVWRGRLKDKSFCVRVKRSGKHDFKSSDLERFIGGGLNQQEPSARVSLKHPDVTVLVEVKGDECFIVHEREQGIGGFPVGTQEQVLSLLSGGFDSTVASYQMIRRGLKTHYCFFNLGGKAHELAVKEVAFFLWKKYGASHRVRFFTVPFEHIVANLLAHVSPANVGVALKRMMLRSASGIAQKGKMSALVTGEAIAQVSSQTLHNLNIIDQASEHLVLRPLITTAKGEIIDIARDMGAESMLASIPEYCGMISDKPSAGVHLHSLLEEEAKLDMTLVEQSIANTKVQMIDDIMNDIDDPAPRCALVSAPQKGDVIVDIRHPNEVELKPLSEAYAAQLEHYPVLEVPFFQLGSASKDWQSSTRYLLYCDRGVMSQLHAQHLSDEGMSNVVVWRPEA